MMLCLSHKTTTSYVEKLGSNHDSEVLNWRDQLVTKVFFNINSANAQPISAGDLVVSKSHLVQSNLTVHSIQSNDVACDSASSSSPGIGSPITSNSSEQSSEQSYSSFIDDIFGPEIPSPLPENHLWTFKIVGDNLDKTIKPRFMTIDNQTKSLHYFNVYAVADRVDTSTLSDIPRTIDITKFDYKSLLPSKADQEALIDNFSFLIIRVLRKYIPYFEKLGSGCGRHIQHQYSQQMARKSTIVPLGIIQKSETTLEEMVEILKILQKYVPTVSMEEAIPVTGTHESVMVTKDKFHKILIGGDQLTASRIRGSQRIVSNSERGKDKLDGFVAVVEDWHTKQCFVGVAWKLLYKCSSKGDVGTLYHLRNVINRRNVVTDPKNDMNACEDFFQIITEAHILSAVMTEFKMSSIDDVPSLPEFDNIMSLDSLKRSDILKRNVKKVCEKFIQMSFGLGVKKDEEDYVFNYACNTLTLGLFFLEHKDCIREGDGLRNVCCWRCFGVIFFATKRKNYAYKAFRLLAQYDLTLSPRMAQQLIWSRTVNTQGGVGKNIACDLHTEHLNHICKSAINGLCSNVKEKSIDRIGKCVGELAKITLQYDSVNKVPPVSGKHSIQSQKKDMEKLLQQLNSKHVFKKQSGRYHKHFKKHKSNIMNSIDLSTLKQWMTEKLQVHTTYGF